MSVVRFKMRASPTRGTPINRFSFFTSRFDIHGVVRVQDTRRNSRTPEESISLLSPGPGRLEYEPDAQTCEQIPSGLPLSCEKEVVRQSGCHTSGQEEREM